MKLPFSIGAMLAPAIGNERAKKLMPVVDVICLFALCTGMAASLGQGVLLLSGGIEDYSSGLLQSGMVLWFISTAVIVVMFVIAAATGVARGIRKLSNINSVLYLILGILVLLFGLQEGLRGFLNAGLVFVMAAVYASFANQITGAAWAIRLCAVLLLVIGVLCMVISAVLYRIVKKEKKTA